MTPNQYILTPATEPNSAEDLREHTRHSCDEGLVLRLAIRPEFGAHTALIRDVSVGGLGLLLSRPLEVGTRVAVELYTETGEARTHLAHVMHARRHRTPPDAPWLPRPHPLLAFFRGFFGPPPPPEDCWFVGCRFDVPVSEDEARQLCR